LGFTYNNGGNIVKMQIMKVYDNKFVLRLENIDI
jgi:hypothetical protein